MDSDLPLSNLENNERKAEFRKPTNDAANRKYRRNSPVAGSSDEDVGNPKRNHSSRNCDKADDKTSSRSRGGDSYGHSSRRQHSRHDDLSRHGKYADNDDKDHVKPPSRSTRESRNGGHSDHRDQETDYNRSRENYRDIDRYSRDRSDSADRKCKTGYDGRHGNWYDDRDRRDWDKDDRDEKRDHWSSRDRKSDRTTYNGDSRGNQIGSSKRESSEVKDKNDELGENEASGEDLAVKRAKLNLGDTDAREADERQTSAKNDGELVVKVNPEQVTVNVPGITVDAAKVAAMKAAELVNKNLSSTGVMTADQKKKLLWGSKKNTNPEESSHRWDTSMFSDRERQEKFNKLMNLRLPWCICGIVGFERRSEGGYQSSKESRCGQGAARVGEAIHRWSKKKGRSNRWVRSLGFYLLCRCLSTRTLFCPLMFFVWIRIWAICSTLQLLPCYHNSFACLTFF